MMANSTVASLFFVLESYVVVGKWKALCFLVVLLLYLVIVFTNVFLVAVICADRSLHEPMYLLLCSLFVNELYGSTSVFPFLLLQILSDIHTVSASFCFLQIFSIYTYANVEFCTLAVMSYDRFVAICRPLQYHTLMTCTRVLVFIVFLWLYAVIKCVITLCLNLQLQLCGNAINSLYCHNYRIAKLACSDSTTNNIYGLLSIVITVMVPLVPILYSYLRILQVCFRGSVRMRQKAVSTCTPHLVSLLNFSCGCLSEIIQTRFSPAGLPRMLRNFFSSYFFVLQPLLIPLMYGMQMSSIRTKWKHLVRVVWCKEQGSSVNK